jgi:hypothetical protein
MDFLIFNSKFRVCLDFHAGKQHRVPFDEGQDWRVKRVLQLVHVDICGPMNMESLIGTKYFLFFMSIVGRCGCIF